MQRPEIRTIGIVYNLKKPSADDTYEEYDEIETIHALQAEVERYGFRTVLLEQDEGFLHNIGAAGVDFVFNIAEGVGRTRGRESQVPCILEALGIPYSGSDPVALGITLDKHLTATILRSAGIPVPQSFVIERMSGTNGSNDLFADGKSYIVKPRWEGSSKGIFLNSVVSTPRDFKKIVRLVLSRYRQPALVEEFIEGDEITAGVYGNRRPKLLGMMKLGLRDTACGGFIYSLENKKEWQEKISYEPAAAVPSRVRALVRQYALEAFTALELRDIARVDFRVDQEGTPRIIDINPLPGLSPRYSDLPILYGLRGGHYADLVKTILKTALSRYGYRLEQLTA